MKRNAFTLAEVLITLVIIGVIAAMTIPTLMGNTNDQQLRSKFKKAVSSVNQAVRLDYALYGNLPYGGEEGAVNTINILRNHLSVIDDISSTEIKVADGTGYWTQLGSFLMVVVDNNYLNLQYNPNSKTFLPWREQDGSALLYD